MSVCRRQVQPEIDYGKEAILISKNVCSHVALSVQSKLNKLNSGYRIISIFLLLPFLGQTDVIDTDL